MTAPYVTARQLLHEASLQKEARDRAAKLDGTFTVTATQEAIRCDITREWLYDAGREIKRLEKLLREARKP